MDLYNRVQELSLERYCCAQIIMAIGLESLKKENPDMLKAMKGLCMGTHTQDQCGTLSGAACMLALFSTEYASVMIQELTGWFEDKYHSTSCYKIMAANNDDLSRCGNLVTETCQRCFEILEKHGLMPDPD